jgi:NAD(P)-dependent dehydrogenase (short-subunit alcohol dehydrogenase family)
MEVTVSSNLEPMSLAGRRVLVTGASSGIGRVIAIVLDSLGANVILMGRDTTRLQETASQLTKPALGIVSFELSDLDAVPGQVKQIAQTYGALDGLVHSAGIAQTIPLKILKFSDFETIMKVNTESAIALVKGFRQRGVNNPGSSIVLLSSISGITGTAGLVNYGTSKGALITATKSMAVELARENIRINCVCPGMVPTPLHALAVQGLTDEQTQKSVDAHPLGFGKSEDVAYCTAFLLAESGRWITGTNVVIDGGYAAR